MLKQLINWYRHTTPGKKLAVSFAANWMIWFIASFLIRLMDDHPRSWGYHLFYATWMAFFMTPISDWKKVKAVFRKESNTSSETHH